MSDTTPAPPEVASPAEPKAAEQVSPPPEPSDEYEIDGQKVTLTRTQARTMLQKAGAVDKRLQQATETQKKLDALLADFESDPEATLAKLGKNPEALIEKMIARKAKLELMSPEQREAQALREERDALKARLEKEEAEKKAAMDSQLDEHNSRALEEQLIAVAQKYNLDQDPDALDGLASIALELLDLGVTPTPDQLGQEFLRREEEHLSARDKKLLPRLSGTRLKGYLKSNAAAFLKLQPDELLEILGPEVVKAIQVATLTKIPAAGQKAKAATPPPPKENGTRYVSEHAFDSRKFGK